MKKKIEFDAWIYGGDDEWERIKRSAPGVVITCWSRPSEALKRDGKPLIPSQKVHIILSLVEDPERSRREPDYKAMWEQMKGYIVTKKKLSPRECNWGALSTQMSGIEDIQIRGQQSGSRTEQHTPQAGVKKEKK